MPSGISSEDGLTDAGAMMMAARWKTSQAVEGPSQGLRPGRRSGGAGRSAIGASSAWMLTAMAPDSRGLAAGQITGGDGRVRLLPASSPAIGISGDAHDRRRRNVNKNRRCRRGRRRRLEPPPWCLPRNPPPRPPLEPPPWCLPRKPPPPPLEPPLEPPPWCLRRNPPPPPLEPPPWLPRNPPPPPLEPPPWCLPRNPPPLLPCDRPSPSPLRGGQSSVRPARRPRGPIDAVSSWEPLLCCQSLSLNSSDVPARSRAAAIASRHPLPPAVRLADHRNFFGLLGPGCLVSAGFVKMANLSRVILIR